MGRSFLTVGGYVYLNKSHKIVGATTLLPQSGDEGGLQFGRPKRWDPAWTKSLMRHGRFHAITIGDFNAIGAFHFCWLRPGEVIHDHEAGKPMDEQPHVPHGGFAYLFHRDVYSMDPKELVFDRYFPVVSGEDYVANEEGADSQQGFFKVVDQMTVLDDLHDQLDAATAGDEVSR